MLSSVKRNDTLDLNWSFQMLLSPFDQVLPFPWGEGNVILQGIEHQFTHSIDLIFVHML